MYFLMLCPVFATKRACLVGKMSSVLPNFQSLSLEQKFKSVLCPKSEVVTMGVNKYIRIMFNARDNIDDGVDLHKSCYPTYTPPFTFLSNDFDQFSDIDEGEASYSSSGSVSSSEVF